MSNPVDDMRDGQVDRLAEKLQQAEQRAERAEADAMELQRALSFAASMIKCGEQWSDSCERQIGDVLKKDHPGQSLLDERDRLRRERDEVKALLGQFSEAFVSLYYGVCPQNWAVDGGNPDMMKSNIQSVHDAALARERGLREALEQIANHTVGPDAEDVKYVQASQWHDMKRIARQALANSAESTPSECKAGWHDKGPIDRAPSANVGDPPTEAQECKRERSEGEIKAEALREAAQDFFRQADMRERADPGGERTAVHILRDKAWGLRERADEHEARQHEERSDDRD